MNNNLQEIYCISFLIFFLYLINKLIIITMFTQVGISLIGNEYVIISHLREIVNISYIKTNLLFSQFYSTAVIETCF